MHQSAIITEQRLWFHSLRSGRVQLITIIIRADLCTVVYHYKLYCPSIISSFWFIFSRKAKWRGCSFMFLCDVIETFNVTVAANKNKTCFKTILFTLSQDVFHGTIKEIYFCLIVASYCKTLFNWKSMLSWTFWCLNEVVRLKHVEGDEGQKYALNFICRITLMHPAWTSVSHSQHAMQPVAVFFFSQWRWNIEFTFLFL